MKKKKKSKKAEVKEQKKAPSKSKSNAASYIIGAIIVIIIIVALVLLLKGRQAPQAPAEQPKPAEQPQAHAEKPTAVSEKPAELKDCSIDFAIGWPKNKLGQPCKIDGNTVTAQLTFSGKGSSISGMWFYITTKSGAVKYFKDSRTVKQGETMSYSIDVGEAIEDMTASPESDGKSCLNQRLLIVKAESCVAG